MKIHTRKFIYNIPWNLFVITLGCLMLAIGINSVVIPHGLVTGGFSGVGVLLFYSTGILTPGIWFLICNIPVFILGWIFVSKRFLLYSLYGMIVLTIFIDYVSINIPIQDKMLAVLAGGSIIGAGAGIIFHSLGSAGGNDIISIMLNQKFGIRIGTYNFIFNSVLFVLSLGILTIDLFIYSMAMSFITSQIVDYFLSIFNQRKMALIISNKPEDTVALIMKKLDKGATFLQGKGAYTGKDKKIILTVVHNYQIKRLEEVVFSVDPDAFLITENTFNVIGKGFSFRKVY
ncbi:MAG: YitT family protein [Desulfobacterales bacterium]|nr:YitT family protein [Desulfobacterales bacterium]